MRTTEIAAPSEDPEEIPRTNGLAIGFLNNPCITDPLIASAIPTSTPSITLGNLRFNTMVSCAVLNSDKLIDFSNGILLRIMLIISFIVIETDPIEVEMNIDTIRKINRERIDRDCFLFTVLSPI